MTKLGISLSSRAMYASWLFHQPTRTMFDAGDGLCLSMLSRIFAIERLVCGHGHTDHVSSIMTLVGLRAKTKGMTTKPLDIYYPADNYQFTLIRDYISKSWPRLPYKLSWFPIEPGFELKLDSSHSLKAFGMYHQKNATTLGYKVIETRTRLRADLRDRIKDGQIDGVMVGAALTAMKAAGHITTEVYHQNVFAYCLDHSRLYDEQDIAGVDLAIMDCTFMDGRDRNDDTHATLEESIGLCQRMGVKRVIAAHCSTRYCDRQIDEAVARVRQLYPDADFTVCPMTGVLEI